MSDLQRPKGKFAVSNGPVNRRTASGGHRAEPPLPTPLVRNRLKAAHAKHRLGAPLTQRMSSAGQGTQTPAAQGKVIALSVACTVSGVGMFVGAIQGAWHWVGICATAFVSVGAWTWRTQRQRDARALSQEDRVAALITSEELQRLDTLLEQVARASSTATVERLVGLKEALVRCVTLAGTHQTQGLLASEDSLFVCEAVRRYVPDSLQALLHVPLAERDTHNLEAGKTPVVLLEEQLALIVDQLHAREARMGQLAGEALLQQQRFLAAKTKSSLK